MHPQTPAPVLTLHEARLGEYDPQDPTDLSLLWSVFSKTSRALENGDRLKNLSWRLWNRETLSRSRQAAATTHRINTSNETDAPTTIPELSSSVDSSSSASDSNLETDLAAVTPLASNDIAPSDNTKSCTDRHITPLDLQHLVQSINHKPDFKALASSMRVPRTINTASPPVYRRPVKIESSTSTVATASDSFQSTDAVSDTSISSDGGSQHSIVRGFVPGTGITKYTSKTQLAPVPAPILKKSCSKSDVGSKKKTGMFMVGGSSAEEEESFRERMLAKSRPSVTSRDSQSSGTKKQTSFKEEVSVMRDRFISNQESEDALESDSEYDPDEFDDGTAVDDDDAWEDDESESNSKEMNFYRVDSKAALTSRRSALTLNLEEQRSGKSPRALSQSSPALRRSRTSTPNGPSIPASPTNESSMEQRAAQIPVSKPIIMTTSNAALAQPLTSPRTTRRNMLAGELSESLRRNMLSERQQKNPLGINQMKRAHTAFDVSKLSRLPEVPQEHMRASDSAEVAPAITDAPRKVSWNRYFENTVGEYHNAGW